MSQEAPSGVAAASHDDETWFAANPTRHLRLRDRIAGEFDTDQVDPPRPGLTPRTLVVHARPGIRVRQPVQIYPHIRNDALTDAQLLAFFQQTASPEIQRMVADIANAPAGAGATGRDSIVE